MKKTTQKNDTMMQQFKKLEKLAQAIVEADPTVIEVIIHQDRPQAPLDADEIFLVCYLNHYGMTNDMDVYEEEAYTWGMNVSEQIAEVIEKLGLTDKEIILTPFNFELHRHNEYGTYFRSLFIKHGYEPILSIADREIKKRNHDFDEEIKAHEAEPDDGDDFLPVENEKQYSVSQVVTMIGIQKRTLQGYLKIGKIKGLKRGNRWYIPESELSKFQEVSH